MVNKQQKTMVKGGITTKLKKSVSDFWKSRECVFVDAETRLPSGEVTSFPILYDFNNRRVVAHLSEDQAQGERERLAKTLKTVRAKKSRGK